MTDSPAKATGYFTHDLAALSNPIENAPENPDRLSSIELMMMAMGMREHLKHYSAREASMETVCLAHDRDYVERLALASAGNEEAIRAWSEADTPVTPLSYRAALKSVGAVVSAVDAVMRGEVSNAFCAVRPPGHHAGRRSGGGFCYFNNAAVGALYAQKNWGLSRIAVLDFDVHHGDGTEDILGGNPAFRYFSLFQWPLYPSRLPESTPENVTRTPLPAGSGGRELRQTIETVWLPGLERFSPELIILSSGFDAHLEDAMAQLKVDESDFAYITRRLMDAAEVCCGGRLVSVLEGGYNLRALSRSVVSHIATLMGLSQESTGSEV